MKFTNIRNLKYSKADKSMVDLFATCEEYGEIPMTLNLVDTEDNHTSIDGDKEVPLEEYCKQQFIQPFVEHIPNQIELIMIKKKYLSDTDFKMTVDYYETLTEAEKVELRTLRAEARAFINTLEAELGI